MRTRARTRRPAPRLAASLAALLLVLVAAGAGAPAPAGAASVSTTEPFCPKGCVEEGTVRFSAAPGEANRVTVTHDADGFLIQDAGAPLTVSSDRCEAIDAHTARCRPLGAIAHVGLGDGDDELTMRAPGYGSGGPGNDVLRAEGVAGPIGYTSLDGEEGHDRLSAVGEVAYGRLIGGFGDDVLSAAEATRGLPLDGGDGDDTLTGSPADDTLYPGPGADTVDGGAGRDTFVHGARTEPLVLSLPDGRSGEDPVVVGVEDVFGGSGADRIGGDDGPNNLQGGGGRDTYLCGGGFDRVRASRGDRLPASGDAAATDCEVLAIPGFFGEPFCLALDRVERAGPRLRLSDPCLEAARTEAHRLELLAVGGGRLATGRVPTGRGRPRLRLTAAGRAALRRGAAADVHVRARRLGDRGQLGAPKTVRVALAIRP